MKTPTKIWLIDSGDGIDWVDDPNPCGLPEDEAPDSVGYLRVDTVARLKAERDALASHVERLHDFLREAPIGNGVCCCGDSIAGHAALMNGGHAPVDEVEHAASAWRL